MRRRALESLLLRAALLREPPPSAWAEHLDRAPYAILPLLYRSLQQLGVDDPAMSRLKGVYRHAWASNQRVIARAHELLDALDAAGIETLVLDGLALARLYYRDDGARPIDRLDVLVHAADALPALRALGHRAPVRTRAATCFALDEPAVRLHWSPYWHPVPERDVWARPVTFRLGGREAFALSPADQLMRTCVGTGAGRPPRVAWIPDAVMIARTGVDWERLATDARRWEMTGRVARALRTLRRDFEVAVPWAALAQLEGARRSIHERAADLIASRATLRGSHHVLHWHRHRRLRAAEPAAAGTFADYWRESLGAESWGAVAAHYGRRIARR